MVVEENTRWIEGNCTESIIKYVMAIGDLWRYTHIYIYVDYESLILHSSLRRVVVRNMSLSLSLRQILLFVFGPLTPTVAGVMYVHTAANRNQSSPSPATAYFYFHRSPQFSLLRPPDDGIGVRFLLVNHRIPWHGNNYSATWPDWYSRFRLHCIRISPLLVGAIFPDDFVTDRKIYCIRQ